MLRVTPENSTDQISTHQPIEVTSKEGLRIGSWHIEKGKALTPDDINLVVKSIALQIKQRNLAGFLLQIPSTAPREIYLKIAEALKQFVPNENFFYQMNDADKIQNLTIVSRDKFEVAKEIHDETPLKLYESLPEDFTFLIAKDKDKNKFNIFINASVENLSPDTYQHLLSNIEEFVAHHPDYEVILGGNFTSDKHKSLLQQTNADFTENKNQSYKNVTVFNGKHNTIVYKCSNNDNSYAYQNEQLVPNEEGLFYFRNELIDAKAKQSQLTIRTSSSFNRPKTLQTWVDLLTPKQTELSEVKGNNDPADMPDKTLNDTVKDIKDNTTNPNTFFPKKSDSELKISEPDVNYFAEELFNKITDACNENGLMFSNHTKDSKIKRDVIHKESGQVQFSIHPKKFTTEMDDQANFEVMLTIFRKIHGEVIEPAIIAPNEKVKSTWQKALSCFGYPPTCVQVRGEVKEIEDKLKPAI